MVRNPLEVAHSMKERNGTSYSFGLRLWEIYNRRLIEVVKRQRPTDYALRFLFSGAGIGAAQNHGLHWFA